MDSSPVPPTAPRPLPPPAGWAGFRPWVPIRSLSPRHRGRIAAHLHALPVQDRYLRFGRPTSDEQIDRYVDQIDFERDEVFGIFDRRLVLIALAHLAYAPLSPRSRHPAMGEFGVSVLPAVRGRGYGDRLFEHAVMHARNRGVATLYIHALSENTAMLRIARKAGATLERDGGESEAWLKLPPDTLISHFEELVETRAAEVDYRIKHHVQQFGGLIDAVGEVRDQILRHGGGGSQ